MTEWKRKTKMKTCNMINEMVEYWNIKCWLMGNGNDPWTYEMMRNESLRNDLWTHGNMKY